jgi:hypothetical protein
VLRWRAGRRWRACHRTRSSPPKSGSWRSSTRLASRCPGLHYRPAQQRPVPVHQHLAGVGGRPVVAAHPRPGRPGAGHRLLGQLLGPVPVAGEQKPDPPQRPELTGEELQEVRVVVCHRPPPEVAVGRTILDQLHAVPARRVAGNQAGSRGNCSTTQGRGPGRRGRHRAERRPGQGARPPRRVGSGAGSGPPLRWAKNTGHLVADPDPGAGGEGGHEPGPLVSSWAGPRGVGVLFQQLDVAVTTLPTAMFIGGEPMKPATKMLAGSPYRCWGRRPPRRPGARRRGWSDARACMLLT